MDVDPAPGTAIEPPISTQLRSPAQITATASIPPPSSPGQLTSATTSSVNESDSRPKLAPRTWNLDVDLPAEATGWPARDGLWETGGRGWYAKSNSSSDLTVWARCQYLEALCLPESIFPLENLVPNLRRLPSELSSSILNSLLQPILSLSARYRRVYPPLLPCLLNTHAITPSPVAEFDEPTWCALRTGLGLWMVSRGHGKGHGAAGGAEKPEAMPEEEWRKLESIKEERRLVEAKRWLEFLERRETLLQILVILLLPPAPPQRRRKRRGTPGDLTSTTVADAVVDPAKAFEQLTDRLSVWQAMGALGVDGSELEREAEREAAIKAAGGSSANLKGKPKPAKIGGAGEDGRDWVRKFAEDVVLPNFTLTHANLVASFSTKVLPPPPPPPPLPLKSTPSTLLRSRSSHSTPTTDPSNPFAATAATTSNEPKARRIKPIARQLPSNANASVRPLVKSSSSSTLGRIPERRISIGGGDDGGRSSLSSSSAGRTTSLVRTGSVGPRAGSVGPPASSSSGLLVRAGSVGAISGESKTDKLLRRSVSFTRGGGGGGAAAAPGLKKVASGKAAVSGGGGGMVKGERSQSRSSLPGGSSSTVTKTTSTSRVLSAASTITSSSSGPITLVPATPSKPKASAANKAADTNATTSSLATFVPETPNFLAETPPSTGRVRMVDHRLGGQGRRLFGGGGDGGKEVDESHDDMLDLFIAGTP